MGAWRDGSAVRTLVTLADKAPIHIREKNKSSGRASVVEGGCGLGGFSILHGLTVYLCGARASLVSLASGGLSPKPGIV